MRVFLLLLALDVLAFAINAGETAPAPRPKDCGCDKSDPHCRARAALSLTVSDPCRDKARAALMTPPERLAARDALTAVATCGVCETDMDKAMLKAGGEKRVMVIFVGGCKKHGVVAQDAGAVPVVVGRYAGDKGRGPRIVVLSPTAPGGGFTVWTVLPADASVERLKKAIADAK